MCESEGSGHKSMSFRLLPSLKHITLVKIASVIWQRPEFRWFYSDTDSVERRLYGRGDRPPVSGSQPEQIIKDRIADVAATLQLPESLEKKLAQFMESMDEQILVWFQHHGLAGSFDVKLDLPKRLFWTQLGTVDGKKTAEVVIRDESIDIDVRYKVACLYGLEAGIYELWNRMPELCKECFYREKPDELTQHQLVVVWTYRLKEVNKLERMITRRSGRNVSLFQFAFEGAARVGTKAAAEYFLPKLSLREREESVVKCARSIAFSLYEIDYDLAVECRAPRRFRSQSVDMLCFLLSEINVEQQEALFRTISTSELLVGLLEWPLQSLFLDALNFMWGFISQHEYSRLLMYIVEDVDPLNRCADSKMFEIFWQQSPLKLRQGIFDHPPPLTLMSSLLSLLKFGGETHLRLVFLTDAPRLKEEFLMSNWGQSLCSEFFRSENWNMLTFFVRECFCSKEVLITFKKELETGFPSALEIREAGTIFPTPPSTEDFGQKARDEKMKFLRVLNELLDS